MGTVVWIKNRRLAMVRPRNQGCNHRPRPAGHDQQPRASEYVFNWRHFTRRLMRSISQSSSALESAATNSYSIQLPNPVQRARGRSLGRVLKWSSLVRPFAHFKKWGGDKSTFWRKKRFVAAQRGNARSWEVC